MVAQIRAGSAPGLVGEGHEGVGVSWFFHEALARVFYRGCAGLRVTNRVELVRALADFHHRTFETAKLYAIDATR